MKNKSFASFDIKSLNFNISVNKCIKRFENLQKYTNINFTC